MMKHFRRLLQWAAVILGALVAFALLGNAVFVWTTDRRLERQLISIRAAGDPLRLVDLARPPLPPEKNAATYLRRAEAAMAAIEKETAKVSPPAERPGFLLSPADQQTIKEVFAAYPHVLPFLEQAASCSDYDAELDYTLPSQEFLVKSLDVSQKPRSTARVLRHRAALLVAEGNHDEAVRTAILAMRLARHFDRNTMIVGYLVAIAVRHSAMQSANEALQTGRVSSEVRGALDTELAVHERMDGFVSAIKAERAYTRECFDDFPTRHFWLASRGFWNMQESACMDIYANVLDLAGNTATYRAIEPLPDKHLVLARLLVPPLSAFYIAVVRTRAEIRALRVLAALQSYAPPGSDVTPELSELTLPGEATIDPFNGRPLHVKRTAQGWLVYSVGQNLQDDGGKLNDRTHGDTGVGPPPVAQEPG